MFKKKFVTLLLAVSLFCCGITGCGSTKDVSSQKQDTEQGNITESSEAEEKSDAAESTSTADSEGTVESTGTADSEDVADMEKLNQKDEMEEETQNLSNLCSNPENWNFWFNPDSSASAELKYTENGIQVEVTNPGTNTWDVQVSYANLNLEKDAHYRLSFDYSGEPQQTMNFSVMQNYPDYASYSTVPLEYKAEPQHYKVEYIMSEATDPNSRITFDCGASKVDGTYTITIENMVLTKVE